MTSGRDARWQAVRRRLRRHRRPLAAGLAFAAVLTAWPSVTARAPSPPESEGTSVTAVGSTLPDGLVAAPVRLADAAVAPLVSVGDVVDVVAADARGQAAVVAGSATVLMVAADGDDPLGGDPFGGALVVVAVPSTTGVALAGAAASGPLSLLLRTERTDD